MLIVKSFLVAKLWLTDGATRCAIKYLELSLGDFPSLKKLDLPDGLGGVDGAIARFLVVY